MYLEKCNALIVPENLLGTPIVIVLGGKVWFLWPLNNFFVNTENMNLTDTELASSGYVLDTKLAEMIQKISGSDLIVSCQNMRFTAGGIWGFCAFMGYSSL